MSGRPTADTVADLRTKLTIWVSDIQDMRREAADRLAELDAEVWERRQSFADLMIDFNAQWNELKEIGAVRPLCPTCGGSTDVIVDTDDHGNGRADNCRDCVDGKVSIEQLAATWRAVWALPEVNGDGLWKDGRNSVIRLLRAVKPHPDLDGDVA